MVTTKSGIERDQDRIWAVSDHQLHNIMPCSVNPNTVAPPFPSPTMPHETSSTTSTYKWPSPLPSCSSSSLHSTIQLLDCPAGTSMPQDTIDANEMATQTLWYINTVNDHASAVHGHLECAAIYWCLLDEKQALPPWSTQWSSLDSHGQNLLRGKMETSCCIPP